MQRLGRFTHRRRRLVVTLWAVVLIAGMTVGGALFHRLTTDMNTDDRLESIRAMQRVEELTGEGPMVVAVVDGADLGDPGVRGEVGQAAVSARAVEGVVSVVDPVTTEGLVSEDGKAGLIVATLAPDLEHAAEDEAVSAVEEAFRGIGAGEVAVGGPALLERETVEQSEKDLKKGETIALPIAMAVMAVVLGGVIAAGIPIVIAMAGVMGAFLTLLGITMVTNVSTYAVNVVTMFGLGLAIDYGLLMIGRFREERAAGHDVEAAVERTVATAGVTVAYSALTVAVSLAGLFVFDEPGLRSLAFGGVAVVLLAMAAGLTLLPALMAMAGRRIKPAAVRANDRGYFFRLSRFVQRRAVPVVVVVGVVLVVLALPFTRARFEGADARSLPRSSETRAVAETLATRFPAHQAEPITVVAESAAHDPSTAAFVAEVEALDDVAAVSVRHGVTGEATVLDVVPEGTSQGAEAQGLVRAIRQLDSGVPVEVTGDAAFLIDFKSSLGSRLPLALAVIVVATFVLLFLMTGSVVVPLKAIVMNVLSLGATFGALVWVFQDGNLSGLLGFDSTGSIEVFVPLLVFIFAFGLSMDYEVFLLSRIKEIHDETGDNDVAVAVGLQRTGRTITSAALLIVVVFAGFLMGEMLVIKQLGLGLAVAVIVDATVVRSLLVPATMKLMGEWNWWAPAPLRRIHQRVGLREPASLPVPAVPDELPEPIAA